MCILCDLEQSNDEMKEDGNEEKEEYKTSDSLHIRCDIKTDFNLSPFLFLKHLSFYECDEMMFLPSLSSLSSLPSLETLEISHCKKLQITSLPNTITTLKLNDFSLSELSFNMPSSLIHLELEIFPNLRVLPSTLSSLKYLTLFKLPKLEELPNNLSSLIEIAIRSLDKITNLPCMPSLKLLNCDLCENISNINFEMFPNLETVRIVELFKLGNIEGLYHLTKLRRLICIGCYIESIDNELPISLKTIFLIELPSLRNLPSFTPLINLNELIIEYCDRLTEMSDLPSSIEKCRIRYCDNLEDVVKGEN